MSTRATVTITGPAERDQIARWARNVEVGTVVTFRKKSRSTEQSAKMWAMLHEVADQVEWYGAKLEAEDWKDVFSASLRHARVVPGIDKGTFVPLGMHTSTLTIEEMSSLIELIYAFGAEHGVLFKEPKEHQSGSPAAGDADEPPVPSSSAEPADSSSSRSAGSSSNTDTTDTRGGSVSDSESSGDGSAPLPSSESRNPETEILIRYARDVLPMAAEPDTTGAMLAAIEKQYAAEDFTRLSKQSLEKAKAISRSMRAIFNNETSLDIALEFYAEAFGCSVETLRGDDNG